MVPLPSNRVTDMGRHDACIERRRSVLSGGAPPFSFVQNSSAPHFSIMLTFYYNVWSLPVSAGDDPLWSDEFHADSVQQAYSIAREAVKAWGSVFGHCTFEFSTREDMARPFEVVFP